jgi:hypothetical protein
MAVKGFRPLKIPKTKAYLPSKLGVSERRKTVIWADRSWLSISLNTTINS